MTPGKNDVVFTVVREPSVPVPGKETFTPGKVYLNGIFFCFSCEDEDRQLEKGGVKVKGRTAIPRGTYELDVTESAHFGKSLPEVKAVPGYTGVRCHGGNHAEDSEGCVLLGQVRTQDGVAKCAEMVNKMIAVIRAARARGATSWLEVK